MGTLMTPEDVVGNGRESAMLLKGLTPVISVDPAVRTQLKCATKTNWLSRYGTAIVAVVVVGLACWGTTERIPHPDVPVSAGAVRAVDGLTIFAAFFVASLGIERLLELLSSAILPKAGALQNVELRSVWHGPRSTP